MTVAREGPEGWKTGGARESTPKGSPSNPGGPILAVGNDVVDLTRPRCQGQSKEERFMNRVFALAEREAILAHPAPDRALWAHWAAKESAYKVVTKLLGSAPVFEHARFVAELEVPEGGVGGVAGTVSHDGRTVPCVGLVNDGWVHLLAWHEGSGKGPARYGPPSEQPPGLEWSVEPLPPAVEGGGDGWQETLGSRFTAREWAAVHSRASAWVRLRARAAAAERLRIAENEVEVVCPGEGPPGRSPPRLYVRGSEVDLDVSLSHHGRLVAWALGGRGPT